MHSTKASSGNGAANQFQMPSDEEVFVLRDEEKRQKAMERDRLKYSRVHEKTTWSARIGSAALKTSVDGLDVVAESRPEAGSSTLRSASAPAHHADASAAHLPQIDVRVKDNMAEYIKKKRKMGLARMSLATKRQEIRKLEEEAERAEKRIAQLEAQIEETSGKFNHFVQHSDMEQVEAQKKADTETKARQEKIAEIKKLNAQIAQVEAERKKHEEQMQSCMEYKAFLDLLTPASYFKEVLVRVRGEDARKALTARVPEHEVEAQLEAAGNDAEEAERRAHLVAGLESDIAVSTERIALEVEDMTPEAVKVAVDRYDPSRVPLFFEKPGDILQKFVETEEGNLFLINQCQELEVDIEKISADFERIEQKMARIKKEKTGQIEEEKRKIFIEGKKLRELQERVDFNASGGSAKAQEDLQSLIETKVSAICKALQLGDDSGVNALGMLTQIEVRFEEMRVLIESSIDRSHVQAVMRQREKERRSAARAAHLEKEREKAEARSQKAMARSQAPVKKRVGKPVMWRSRPLDQKKQEVANDDDANATQDADFFM